MNVEIARMFAFLGIVILLITAVGGTAPPGWAALQTSLTTGFPVFTNPFAQSARVFTLSVVADGGDGPKESTDNDAISGCTSAVNPVANYWGCVASKDAAVSDDMINGITDYTFEIRLGDSGGVPGDQRVVNVTVNYQCKTDGATHALTYFRFSTSSLGTVFLSETGTDGCRLGNYQNYTANATGSVYDAGIPVSDFENSYLTIELGNSVVTHYSFVSVTITYSPGKVCTGSLADQANCAIAEALQFIIDAITFIFNVFIFLLQLAVFFGTLVIEFFIGLIQAFVWLLGLDPASPMFAAPDLVKATVAVLVFSALAYIAIEGALIVSEVIGAFIP